MSTHCVLVSAGEHAEGRTGVTYAPGISRVSAGSSSLSLQLASLPPGARSNVHQHDTHESAAYVIEGELVILSGAQLEHEVVAGPGDFVYIPSGVPHMVRNSADDAPAVAVLARTDADEQEDVTHLPELEDLPHVRAVTRR